MPDYARAVEDAFDRVSRVSVEKHETCPGCGSNQRAEDTRYWRTIMVEIRGVYDGGLFYQCPDCGHRWHRWSEGSDLRQRAAEYVEPSEADDA